MTKIKGARILAGTQKQIFESEIEYILHRPHNSIGSCVEKLQEIYVYNGKFHKKSLRYNPGLLKIVDEVITNSVDEAIRHNFKIGTKIKVSFNGNEIIVQDDGNGIEVLKDNKLNKYLPEILFTNLKTGSNFDDGDGNELAGVNGLGGVLTNIFSKQFKIVTCDGKKQYTQTFTDNLKNIGTPKITNSTKKGTTVSFIPDYEFFKCTKTFLKTFHILIEKRVKDLSFAYPEISFYYNKSKISSRKNKDLLSDINSEHSFTESDKVRIGAVRSPTDTYESIGFVNGCETNKGTHVNYVTSKIVENLRPYIKKKFKLEVKPNDIKNHLMILVALRMPKPMFDHQTKTVLESKSSDFSERIDLVLTNKFFNKLQKDENLINDIIEIYQLRAEKAEKATVKKLQKNGKRVQSGKYVRTNAKKDRILFIGEGDSAMSSFASSRLKNMAGIPIKGKFVNIYEEKEVDVIKHKEVNLLCQIIGLQIGKRADNINFDTIAILSDQDHDGDHITALLINFFYRFWPSLLIEGKIIRVLSPLFIARKGKEIKKFYQYEEYNKFDNTGWNVDYNKGLGSLTLEDYKEVIRELKHIKFEVGDKTDETLKLVFSADSGPRKKWLTS